MAQSRLEKVGTIYSRATSLIKSGAVKEENRPFWLDIYKAFPPKYEPTYDRVGSFAPVKQIFYPEDKIRARFHKENKNFSMVNLISSQAVSRTEQFLMIYKHLQVKGVPEEELYEKSMEEFLATFKVEQVEREEAAAARASQKSKRGISEEKAYKNVTEESHKTASSELSPEEKKTFKPIKFSLEKIIEDTEDSVKKSE